MRKRSAGDLIAGKYRLEKPLACGGMGEVWAATNLQLDVPVALKLMSAHALASDDLVARFEREAKAAAQLRHPNVITIHEYGVFEGVPFMTMELLEGEDLNGRLKARGRLSHAEASPIVRAVCKALGRAQQMGIVHRDLKPANVFLARQDDEEIVKVLDFGIAKLLHGVLGAAATRSGTILGSPFYMSPEQARSEGAKIDHRTDLWALGVMAFRMLTGRLPFWADPPLGVLLSICSEAPPAPSSIAPDLDGRTDAFFARALAQRPEDRFQSAKELAAAFAALGDHAQSHLPAQTLDGDPPAEAPPAASRDQASPAPHPARSGWTLGQPAPQAETPRGERLGTVFVEPAPRQDAPRPTAPSLHTQTVFIEGTTPQISVQVPPSAPPPGVEPARAVMPVGPGMHALLGSDSGVDRGAGTSAEAELHLVAPPRTTAIVTAAVVAAALAILVVVWTVLSTP